MIYMYDKKRPWLAWYFIAHSNWKKNTLEMGFEKHVKEYYQNTEQELS